MWLIDTDVLKSFKNDFLMFSGGIERDQWHEMG